MRQAAVLAVAPLVGLLAWFTPARVPALASVRPLYDTAGVPGCTGFSINQHRALWLTARHCVSAPVTIDHRPASILRSDEANDLALLRTDHGAPALFLALAGPQLGDPVSLIGFPFGAPVPLFMTGRIANPAYPLDFDGHKAFRTISTAPACSGHSGSPLLDDMGAVVSVVQSTTPIPIPCGLLSLGPTVVTLRMFAGDVWEAR